MIGVVVSWIYFVGECVTLAILLYLTLDGVIAIDINWYKKNCGHESVKPSIFPHVTVHVPISNEPVDLVRKTLYALSMLDYPSYDVIVIDNNTHDAQQWMPIRDTCADLGFAFHHVDKLEGFKAGALNLALSLTQPQTEIIAVVDADYIACPEFLLETVPLFSDERVAFVQTAQGYRNEFASVVSRQFFQVYRYFFNVTMVARNQRNSIIFAGTMGLIRRFVLDEVSGWAEWSVTEDAELSLRLLAKGYRGIYINRKYGEGLMPENFVDLRRQWYRWVFGGLQLAIRHMRTTLLNKNPNIALTLIQRVDYIFGSAISLLASLMVLTTLGLISTNILLALSFNNSTGWEQFPDTVRALSTGIAIYHGFLFFHSFSVCYICVAISGCSWQVALRTLVSFQSLVGTFAKAASKALIVHQGVFMRTPKHSIRYDHMTTVREIRLELLLLTGLAGSMFFMAKYVPLWQFSIGLMVLGSWQIIIYASNVIRAFQSSMGLPIFSRRQKPVRCAPRLGKPSQMSIRKADRH